VLQRIDREATVPMNVKLVHSAGNVATARMETMAGNDTILNGTLRSAKVDLTFKTRARPTQHSTMRAIPQAIVLQVCISPRQETDTSTHGLNVTRAATATPTYVQDRASRVRRGRNTLVQTTSAGPRKHTSIRMGWCNQPVALISSTLQPRSATGGDSRIPPSRDEKRDAREIVNCKLENEATRTKIGHWRARSFSLLSVLLVIFDPR